MGNLNRKLARAARRDRRWKMEKLSREDRCELAMWQARVEAAQVRLEAIQAQYNAVAQRVTGAYNITPVDRINLESGEITRGPKPVEPPPVPPSA